jgi:hypothetical protein
MDLHLHMYVYFHMLIHNSFLSHIFDKKELFYKKGLFYFSQLSNENTRVAMIQLLVACALRKGFSQNERTIVHVTETLQQNKCDAYFHM